MGAASFCTVTASVKRNSDLGGGITGEPVTHIASLAITPVWPIQRVDQVQALLELASARELKECYHVPTSTTLPDVKEGDLLVLGTAEYPILHVMEWTDWDVPALQIIVQDVKQ